MISNVVNNFINELKEYLEKEEIQDMINLNIENKYIDKLQI